MQALSKRHYIKVIGYACAYAGHQMIVRVAEQPAAFGIIIVYAESRLSYRFRHFQNPLPTHLFNHLFNVLFNNNLLVFFSSNSVNISAMRFSISVVISRLSAEFEK